MGVSLREVEIWFDRIALFTMMLLRWWCRGSLGDMKSRVLKS